MRSPVSGWAGTAPEVVGDVDGIVYVDDSKATNPHAGAGVDHRVPAGRLDRRWSAEGAPRSTNSSMRWRIAWSVRC
jgi:hypothetical protein